MNKLVRSGARIVFGSLLPRLAYPVLCGPLRGARFVLGALAGQGGGATVYLNRVEPEQTSVFVDTLKDGQEFFDIGANVGYYTVLAARLVGSRGRVVAFEPAIRNLAFLYQHTLLNKTRNVTIVAAACSDILALAAFSSGPNFAMGHIIDNTPREDSTKEGTFPVLTVTVDAIVQQLGVPPDVIKIDLEGAEALVLAGAQATLRETRPKIFLSTHSEMLRLTCLEYLRELGYTSRVLSQDKDSPSEFLAEYTGV